MVSSGVCGRRFNRSQDLHVEARGAARGLIARREQWQDVALYLLDEVARGAGAESHFVPVRRHTIGTDRGLVGACGRLEHRESRIYTCEPFRSSIGNAPKGFNDRISRTELLENRRDLRLELVARVVRGDGA